MPGSFIEPENNFAVLSAIFIMTSIGMAMEKTAIGRRVSGAMIVIILSAVLANLGLTPPAAPVYDFIWTYLVPLAIALFLIKADFVSIVKQGGRVLIAFLIGAAGAVVGSLAGPFVLDLGANGAEYAAIFGATFTGGALNFAAVAEAINFKDPTRLAAAIAIDNVLGLGYLILLSSLASWPLFQKYFPAERISLTLPAGNQQAVLRPSTVLDSSLSMALACLACALGAALATTLGFGSYSILFITLLMITAATTGRRYLQNIKGEELIATLFMYMFFALLGAGADVKAMLDTAPALFFYVIIILVVHLAFLLVGAKLFRLNFAETIIASSACIGGPPIAAAFAVLFGWQKLATAGIVTGVFGYATGNFIGVGIFRVLGG